MVRRFVVVGDHYQRVAIHVCIPTYFARQEWRMKAGMWSVNTDVMFKPKT